MILKNIFPLIALFFIAPVLWANSSGVTLFEQNRTKSDLRKQEAKTAVPVEKKKKNSKTLNKKLIGIQRFGPRYTLIFKNKQGRQERFIWIEKQNQKPVEIETGFTIEQVEQRLVKIKLSQQVRCEADKKKQIDCPDAEHMTLAIQRNKVMIKKKNHLKMKKGSQNSADEKKLKSPGIKKISQQDQDKKVKNPFLLMMQKSQKKQMPGL